MPGGDGTGPLGQGSMTGRGLGYCVGYAAPGFTWGRGYGRGQGFGRGLGYGRGLGFRRWRRNPYTNPVNPYYATGYSYPDYREGYFPSYGYGGTPSKEDETAAMQSALGEISDALSEIERRITELEKK
mgnify:CR=1 FL=1